MKATLVFGGLNKATTSDGEYIFVFIYFVSEFAQICADVTPEKIS